MESNLTPKPLRELNGFEMSFPQRVDVLKQRSCVYDIQLDRVHYTGGCVCNASPNGNTLPSKSYKQTFSYIATNIPTLHEQKNQETEVSNALKVYQKELLFVLPETF